MLRIIAAVLCLGAPAAAEQVSPKLPEIRDYVLGIVACERAMETDHFYEWERHRDFFIAEVNRMVQQPARGERAYMDAKKYMDAVPLSADERKADPQKCLRRLSHLKTAFTAAIGEFRAGIRQPASP